MFDHFICYHLESRWYVIRPNQGLSLERGRAWKRDWEFGGLWRENVRARLELFQFKLARTSSFRPAKNGPMESDPRVIPAIKGPRAEKAVFVVINIPQAAGTWSSSTQSVTKMGLMPYRPPSRRPVTMKIASRWFAVAARGTVKRTIPHAEEAA